MILAGDVGGTNVRLALFAAEGETLRRCEEAKLPSRDFPSLDAAVARFLGSRRVATAAAFGIAGPVANGRSKLTNLGWDVVADEIREDLKIGAVGLLNDLEATAYGTLHLAEPEKAVLQPGTAQERAAITVIAAGTGLGEGALVWDGRQYRAVPTEGGHADFAARNELEAELLAFLLKRYEHVSWERLLSGPGIYTLYEFLRSRSGVPEPGWLKEQIAGGDPTAAVSHAGMEGKDPVCSETLDLFVSLYGAEAGNLTLKFLGTGGLYVGGGIAPKILARMQSGAFVEAFTAKGRFRDLLRRVPAMVITNDRIALAGAAHYAQLLSGREA